MNRSSHRTLKVIEALALRPEGINLTDLRQIVMLPTSSLHEILLTMTTEGWVTKDKSTHLYTLTPKLFEIASRHISRVQPIQTFHQIAAEMIGECGETIQMGILQGPDVLFIAREDGTHPIRLSRNIGDRAPAYALSMGKVLLAEMDAGCLEEYLKVIRLVPITPHTISSVKVLKRELATVKRMGYACNLQESVLGIFAVAAPIRDISGRAIAAMNISALSDRTPPKKQRELTRLVIEGARKLGLAAGGRLRQDVRAAG